MFIQSFEMGNLQALHGRCAHPLVQLMQLEGGPWDRDGRDEFATYAQLATPAGLQRIAQYAQAIGAQKEMVIGVDAAGRPQPTCLVRDAHAAGLAVHVWTFRAENHFLPQACSAAPTWPAMAISRRRSALLSAAGIDGLFCDHPGIARVALQGL